VAQFKLILVPSVDKNVMPHRQTAFLNVFHTSMISRLNKKFYHNTSGNRASPKVWQMELASLIFGKKHLKHPSNSLANDLAKYGNLAKTLPHHAYLATWQRAWQILSLLACCVLTTKIKSSPCLHAAYCLFLFILPSPK